MGMISWCHCGEREQDHGFGSGHSSVTLEIEFDGTCACGKIAMDGVRCKYGATHQPLLRMPWDTPKKEKFPWE
jgi:hypothetical protein